MGAISRARTDLEVWHRRFCHEPDGISRRTPSVSSFRVTRSGFISTFNRPDGGAKFWIEPEITLARNYQLTLERPAPDHLHWPELDVDLSLDSIEHPERYPSNL